MEFKGKTSIKWRACFPELNPIKDFWRIVKREPYQTDKQYASKETLWKAIQDVVKTVLPSTIKTMTESSNNCIFEVIKMVHTSNTNHSIKSSVDMLFIYFVVHWYISVM